MSDNGDYMRLRETFNEDAERYDRARPRYPAQMFDDLAAAGVAPGARVLEIGCGSGQATVPLAERGYRIVAVELGADMADVARRNLAGCDSVEVVTAAFEDWPLPREPFDLVFSATAFHWIDPAVRVSKSADALRLGGLLATVGTHHIAGGTWTEAFFAEIQKCYERYDPSTPPGLRLEGARDTEARPPCPVNRFVTSSVRRLVDGCRYFPAAQASPAGLRRGGQGTAPYGPEFLIERLAPPPAEEPPDEPAVESEVSYAQRVCVSAANARFSGTIIYAGRMTHGSHGPIEVLGYQNTAVNLDAAPNAMLLHLPAVEITPHQFLRLGEHTDILTRMARLVRPIDRGIQAIAWMSDARAVVFDHDIYTIVLAADATAIPAALKRVPANRRPVVHPDLFDFYATAFPLHTIALCCFDNRDAVQAKPLMLWYEPLDPQRIVVPAVDCHTGRAPDRSATVRRDHCLVFGTDQAGHGWGQAIEYAPGMRHSLRAFLPDRIIGRIVRDDTANRDFAITSQDLLAGRTDRISLVMV